MQPLGSSTLFKLSSSVLLLGVFFTVGARLLFVADICKLALFVIVLVCVIVCVKVLVAQMQVEGFDMTVTVTVLATFCWHGSTTVMVVGIHDLVGFMTASVGKVAEKDIKTNNHIQKIFISVANIMCDLQIFCFFFLKLATLCFFNSKDNNNNLQQ